MKRHYMLILSILLCSFWGCKQKKAERVSLENITRQELAMEQLVRLPGQSPPTPYLLTDSIILISHPESSSFLGVYLLGDSVLQRHSLKKRGDQISIPTKSDFQASFQFFNQKTLAIYQVQNGLLTLDDFIRFNFANDRSPFQLVQLKNDLYACLGNYTEGIFALCERKKKEMAYTGDFPIDEPAAHAYIARSGSGQIAKRENQLIYATGVLGYIASYEYKWGRLKKQWEKQVSDYHYTIKEDNITFDPDRHLSGFGDIHITDKHIYTIYWGQTKSMGLEIPNSIVVFDRKGNPLAYYLLPDQMSSITVDSREEYLYATYSPLINECYLVRFKLPVL
ncbi:TolB-like 6-bladed beta-propeller domain-containing protein [Parabacteroides sp. OttesenSCG-928-G07]|nr:TolB-like 6-bladed beta-propeller domain-containing protein [Parabacteroides sp. OttesenSCG-928-G21]MDL2278242.1 TolB-like 6-bladed beta-propeller domain-containing protein [Parabacteroides sp. OttesenSCG-928-G07]